jgi:hypothetical protein
MFAHLLLAVFCWCLLANTVIQAQELHPRLRNGELKLRRVLVLPPGVAVMQQGIAGKEPLDQDTEHLMKRLTQAAITALAAQGLEAVPNPYTRERLLQDEQLRYELADLQARYDLQATNMHRDKKALARGEFSFGKEVAHLNQQDQADAFLLLRAYGSDPTLAKTTFALLVPFGGTAFSTLYLSLALLDARTGDVLYLTGQTLSGNFRAEAKADKLLAKALAKALKKLPATNSSR